MKKNKATSKGKLFWYLHPHLALVIGLIIVNLIIILVFTGLLSLASGNTFLEELPYCFLLTMAADGIYDFTTDKDVISLCIKLVMVLLQMVVFSGALIGFITNVLENLFDKAMNHRGKLKLKNHYVILGWSTIGPNLIYDMSFLDQKQTVVILTTKEREEVKNDIKNIFSQNGKKIKNLNILIKNGEPSNLQYLSEISIENAAGIGILYTPVEENNELQLHKSDLNSFILLMSIIHLVNNANIVVEVETGEMKDKIEKLFKNKNITTNHVSVFSNNLVTGHILGKSIINQQYFNIYFELLGYDGVELYSLDPMPLEDALSIYNNCVPMANYDDDDEIDENGNKKADHLYVLGEDSTCSRKRNEKLVIKKELPYRENKGDKPFTIFIIGENAGLPYLIQEFKDYQNNTNNLVTIKSFNFSDNLENIIEEINNTKGNRKLLLLSDDREEEKAQDSNVYITLLNLKILNTLDKEVEISIEISNPNNIQSLKNLGVTKVIITNKIISLYMLQLLTHSNSIKFYRDIITSNTGDDDNDVDIEIYDAEELLDVSVPLRFNSKTELVQSFFYSTNKKMILFGYRNKLIGQEMNYLCNDMDKEEEIIIDKNTEIVIINCNE